MDGVIYNESVMSVFSAEKEKLHHIQSDLFNALESLNKPETPEPSYECKTKDDNLVQSVIENEAYCFDVEKFAAKLIDATAQEAIKNLSKSRTEFTVFDIACPIIENILNQVLDPLGPNDLSSSSSLVSTSSKSETPPMAWPITSEFNIKLGQEEIEKYVETWQRSSDWLFCVEFIGFESEDCSNVFVYEVEWSKPTWSYPIPQATASVYFALDAFKMVSLTNDPGIEVSYVFECSSLIHKPGKTDFQEKWLQYIIDEKIKIFKKMTFSVPAGFCGPTRPAVGETYWSSVIESLNCSKKRKKKRQHFKK